MELPRARAVLSIMAPEGMTAVELIAIFDGAVIAVRHLVEPEVVMLGCARGAWLPLPDGVEDFTLLSPCERGWELRIPRDGAIHALALVEGDRFSFELGPLTLLVSLVPAPERMPVPFTVDRTLVSAVAGCALAAAALLLIVFSMPPVPPSLGLGPGGRLRLAGIMLTAPVLGPRPGSIGGSAPFSTRNAPKTKRARPISRKPSRVDAAKAARGAGALGALRAFEGTQVAASFARESALGAEAEAALDDLDGSGEPDAFGAGGLGLVGNGGDGEGGLGGGTIALGSIGTLANGAGGGRGGGYGRGAGGLCGGRPEGCRRAVAPEVIECDAVVSGSLDRAIVRRVVRRHLNEIRFCYEKRLVARPELRGRVATRFVIAGNGLVVAATVESSTIDDPEVERCVAAAIRRWQFSAPQGGGAVVVSYPFTFQPAE